MADASQPTVAPMAAEVKQDMKDDKECGLQSLYLQTWSKTLHDIVFNFLRKNDYLPDGNDSNQLKSTPKEILDTISLFYANDQTNYKSYYDYVTAILLCRYLNNIKKMKKDELSKNEQFSKLKTDYNLKKSSLTAKKMFKVLKDYKEKKIGDIDTSIIDNFYVLFIDQSYDENIVSLSYPKNTFKYKLSADEIAILDALKNYHKDTEQLTAIKNKGYFKTGTKNKEIKYHTIIEHNIDNSYIYALDYPGNYSYFIFQFRFFAVLIHDTIKSEEKIGRRIEGAVAASQYRSLMEQWTQSGL